MFADHVSSRHVLGWALLATLAGPLGASGAQEPAQKITMKDLQGRWQLVYVAQGNEERSRRACLESKTIFEINGDAYTYSVEGRVKEKGKLTLDASKTPAQLDFLEEGQDKSKAQLVIVRMNKGVLEWCDGGTSGLRPKEFRSARGSKDTFARFERTRD